MLRLDKRIVVASATLCVVAAAASSRVNVAQLQAGSLCEKDEQIVFSCTIRRPVKIVSLCSSKELTKDRGYLQYRFGLPQKIELEFPKQREQTQAAFKYSHYFRAQFDLTEINFSTDGHQYAIFDDYNGEQKPVQHEQGIKITPPNGKAKAQYGDLAEVLPEPE